MRPQETRRGVLGDRMTAFLPALAIAFAALCVWLAVRIVNRRERWAKWTLASAVGLPVMYVASFGPACWLVSHDGLPRLGTARIYRPLVHISNKEVSAVSSILCWYAEVLDAEIARCDKFGVSSSTRLQMGRWLEDADRGPRKSWAWTCKL